MLSSSRYRTSPPATLSTVTSDRSTSRLIVSRTAEAGHAQRRHHPLGGVQRCAAGEAGQRPEAALVVREQQLIAPPDGPFQGPSTIRATTVRVAQDGEPVVQPPGDVAYGEGPHPGRGELDRQRQPVERFAHLGHRGGGRRVEHELAAELLGSADEQGDRLLPRQRLELVVMLTVQTEWRLAGGEHPQLRQGVEQRLHQLGHPVEHVLAVVQQQDGPGPREPLAQRRLAAGDVERLGHHHFGQLRRRHRERPDGPATPRPAG